ETLAGSDVSGRLVPAPHVPELDGFDVGLHYVLSADSGPWMALCVGGLEPRGLYPSVNLRRGDGSVPQKLLDRAQVRAALEQVRGEGVAQGMGRDAALHLGVAGPRPQPPAHVGGRQPPARLREEQRRAAIAVSEGGPRALEVAGERLERGLADGHDPRLAALALDAQLLVVERDRGDVERHELLGPQAA